MPIMIVCHKTTRTDLAFLGSDASGRPSTQTYPMRKRAEAEESLLREYPKISSCQTYRNKQLESKIYQNAY